jgi:hypothetical protein
MDTTLIGCYGISPQYTYHSTNLEVRNELTFKPGISVRDVTKETLNVLILNFIV